MSPAANNLKSFTQAARVKVNGVSLDAEWARLMISLSLEMQLQLPTRLIMRFSEPGLGSSAPAFPFAFAKTVTVEFPADGDDNFTALGGKLHVTEIGAERIGPTPGELVVVAHDASYWLAQAHQVATYTEMSSSEVVQKLARDAGLAEGTIEASGDRHKYLLQTDTAAGFITTLARRVGFDWWVDDDKLYFAKPATGNSVEVAEFEEVISMTVSQQLVGPSEVTVTGWDRDTKSTVTSMQPVRAASESKVPGTSGTSGRRITHTTSSLRAESDSEAGKLAKSISDRYRSASVQVDGEAFGNPAIRPRTELTVKGAHLGGTYEIVRVEHRYSLDGYFTRFTGGDRVPTGLADFIGGSNLPEHFGAYQGLPALIPGVVTAIGTSEHLGRVQVKFPYLSEENSSHWARVLSAGGGPDRGLLFMPEVDDEVLVAFEGGDTRFPVVMGGVHQKVYSAEDQLIKDGKINSRSLRSRLGHYMDFYDGDQDTTRHIALGLGSGGRPGNEYKLRIGEDRFDIEVPEGKPISIKAGKAQITFTDSSSIEINADNISIKAETEVSIEGKKINLKGQTEVAISQGSNKVALAGSGVDIKGTPQTNIKGGPKVNIG